TTLATRPNVFCMDSFLSAARLPQKAGGPNRWENFAPVGAGAVRSPPPGASASPAAPGDSVRPGAEPMHNRERSPRPVHESQQWSSTWPRASGTGLAPFVLWTCDGLMQGTHNSRRENDVIGKDVEVGRGRPDCRVHPVCLLRPGGRSDVAAPHRGPAGSVAAA